MKSKHKVSGQPLDRETAGCDMMMEKNIDVNV